MTESKGEKRMKTRTAMMCVHILYIMRRGLHRHVGH